MKKRKSRADISKLKDGIKSEIIRFISLIIMLNMVMWKVDPNIYTSADMKKILVNNSAVLGSSFITLLLVYILRGLTKPVQLNINILNKASKDQFTHLYHNHTSREDSATIKISVTFKNTGSLWNRLAMFALKGRNIAIHIHDDPHISYITCQPTSFTDELRSSNNGFIINADYFIRSNLQKCVEHKKDFECIIRENRDSPIQSNEDIPIKPLLLIDNKEPGFFIRKFIVDMEIENDTGWHTVKFIK